MAPYGPELPSVVSPDNIITDGESEILSNVAIEYWPTNLSWLYLFCIEELNLTCPLPNCVTTILHKWHFLIISHKK